MSVKNVYDNNKCNYIKLKTNDMIRGGAMKVNNNDNDNIDYSRPLKITLNLIFDLLQVSQDILRIITKKSVIILVGDTPSYLKPFLEPFVDVHNLPLSSKPYGCFDFISYGYGCQCIEKYQEMWTPIRSVENKFFKYLNTKTSLTKKFIKTNWDNIILVDSSSGVSIRGVSILLNRYVNNIQRENENKKCCDIKGAKPLKFINLNGVHIDNPDPPLIITIPIAAYYYHCSWALYGDTVRYVPSIDLAFMEKLSQGLPYIKYTDPEYIPEGLEFIKPFYTFVDLFYKYQSGDKKILKKFLEFIKGLSSEEPYHKIINKLNNDNITVEKFDKLFEKISSHIHNLKYGNILEFKKKYERRSSW